MNLIRLLNHPELLNRTTLFQLREEVARHPYFVPARLLFLQNLFLLHDADFGSELRKAALMVPDRSLLYEMVEGETRMSDYAELSDALCLESLELGAVCTSLLGSINQALGLLQTAVEITTNLCNDIGGIVGTYHAVTNLDILIEF